MLLNKNIYYLISDLKKMFMDILNYGFKIHKNHIDTYDLDAAEIKLKRIDKNTRNLIIHLEVLTEYAYRLSKRFNNIAKLNDINIKEGNPEALFSQSLDNLINSLETVNADLKEFRETENEKLKTEVAKSREQRRVRQKRRRRQKK